MTCAHEVYRLHIIIIIIVYQSESAGVPTYRYNNMLS